MASAKKNQIRSKDDLKQQEITQAVVIADNFNLKFIPLTNAKPLVLLPLVNGVLLDYVLKSLEDAEIQETYIFCCSHNALIRSYISSSRWASCSMSVSVLSSTTFLSMGDIMRELDTKGLIRSDFILINGDVITTYPLSAILEQHRKLRQVDKNCALTVLYRKALPKHRTRCKEHSFVVAVESNTQRIRYFQRIEKSKSIHIPLEVFQENDEVTVHHDLLDSYVSICSPCVPPLFSDNFDYQSMDDFVKGLIVNEELLGNSMYIHIAKSGYGASVSNFCMYDAISQDMISRWTYPVVPDLLELSDKKYLHSRYNVYKEACVEIGRNSQIRHNVVIGKGSTIGDNAVITNSVIGRNCVIGDNVVIKGSYLWNNVSVGNGCTLQTCLLADKVKVFRNVTIKPGCILGSEVVIDDNVILHPLTKLQAEDSADDDDFGEDDLGAGDETHEKKACDVELVGKRGRGFPCTAPEESDDDERDEAADVWGEPSVESEGDDSESSSSEILTPEEAASDESEGPGDGYDDEATFFYGEVLESLQRGIEEKVNSENMILEINSSKHAYNISMKEVNALLIKAILKLPLESEDSIDTPQQYLLSVKPSLQFFQPLVSNYIRSVESQMDCLLSVQEFMRSYEDLAPAMMKVLHFWYDKDILNENVIFKWFRSLSSESEKIKNQVVAFVKWLQEADEESSEED